MLVFMLEELSMKRFLEGLLPRVLPPEVHVRLIPHEGKADLEKSIPRKLRAWRTPDTRFVVVRDQDSGDCARIKQRLAQLCRQAGKPESHIVIVCRELEAWFIGDLAAVSEAYGRASLAALRDKARYRVPDLLSSPSRELEELVPGYGKVDGARRLGKLMHPRGSRSQSFAYFIRTVTALAQAR